MQSLKIDFLTKYNELLNSCLNASPEFPNNICEFLSFEFDLAAVVLFKVNDDNSFSVQGKSNGAKKSYIKDSLFHCNLCRNKLFTEPSVFNIQNDCEILASDFIIYEGCLLLNINESDRALFKLAKKTPFSKAEKDNIEVIGHSVRNLLQLWMGNKRGFHKSVSEIITDIAHELRTPTNSIMGFASLLNEDNLTPSQGEYVLTLKENAFNLLSLINDLIDLSKIDAGITKENITSVNLKQFIDDIFKVFSERQNNNRIEFLVNIEKEIPESIRIDSQKLRFILMSILSYSLRLTEKGKITLSVCPNGSGKLIFKINDTSNGLPSNKLKDFFNPFAISDLTSAKLSGVTGLGLTLSKRYIEFLKGNIEVSSSLGKGTTYNFNISTESLNPIVEQLKDLPKPGKKNKVLVIEDDYATSKLLSNYLNKWGYEPTLVNSADQALKAIDREIYLAVLMDIVLPDANGFELLKQIKEHKNAKNTPVIVCSVEAEQQKAFLMGAVEYFEKPIKYKYLVEVLASYRLKKDSNILIVDDDLPTLNLIREAVIQAGYNAFAEHHPSKVMGLIENINLDIAIIDLDMPEINGFDLIKMIKINPRFAKLPIVIYTGKENYKDDLKRIDGMFSELLLKSSSNIEDLADTITQMINRYDEPSPPDVVLSQKGVTKILLVEDYKHSQIIVTRLLKKNNFESIVVVENGAEALDQVKKQKFDLILMDMQMPVMNGFEATEKIRQLHDYKDTPIIALTAFAMKGDREKCLEAGATDYIPKPIDSQEFIEKVKYYTEKSTVAKSV